MRKVIGFLRTYALILLVFSGVLFLFFGLARVIRISEIDCESQFGPCDEGLQASLETFEGNTLFQAKRYVAEYLKDIHNVEKFDTRFKLPSSLTVTVIQKKSEFAVKSGEKTALVDKDGRVLGNAQNSLLPTIVTSYELPEVNERLNESTFFALRLLAHLNYMYQIKEGVLESGKITFELPQGQKFVFPEEGDMGELLGSLILINNQLNRSTETPTMNLEGLKSCQASCVVDLRFKNPVVKFSQ